MEFIQSPHFSIILFDVTMCKSRKLIIFYEEYCLMLYTLFYMKIYVLWQSKNILCGDEKLQLQAMLVLQ